MTNFLKQISFKKILPWIAIGAVAIILALLPVITAKEDDSEVKATIKNEQAAIRDIDTILVGGGQIESSGVFDLKIPENVKIKEYLVSNGDTVKEGDPIAIVDPISTKSAIVGIQDTLDELADQIRDADSSSTTTYITSVPSGTVKKVYAQPGDSVEEVMLESGSLAVISLDGTMGVSIQADTSLKPGDKVNVEIDGTTVTGRVKTNANGVVKLTVTDKNYEIGQLASVYDADNNLLGSGMLYVYNPWNVNGTSGTISYVYVREGNTVYAGQTLFSVSEAGKNSDYQKAIDKHQKYEELLKETFKVYSQGYIAAPCDGIVSGIDTTSDYMLSYNPESGLDENKGFKLVLLSDEEVRVATITGNLVDGTKGTAYQSAGFTATDESGTVLYGTWSVDPSSLPSGLVMDASTGIITGTPTVAGSFIVRIGFVETVDDSKKAATGSAEVPLNIKDLPPQTQYYAYAAQISLVNNGEVKGKRAENPIIITDLKDLSSITPSASALTTEFDIFYADSSKLSKNSLVWIVVSEAGEIVGIQSAGGSGGGGGGSPSGGGGMPSGGMSGFSGAVVEEEDDGLYSLDTVVVGTVTSQEEMTVSITIDELDITKVYVGQIATITMNSFAEEPVPAVVTNISNSGENSGGNSKFTVDLMLNKSSEMLPGMNATATITLDTASDVLSVPSAAIYTLNGKKVVYTSYNEKEELLENPVEVETGVADADYVQILSGLSESDTVFYEIYETIGRYGVSTSV